MATGQRARGVRLTRGNGGTGRGSSRSRRLLRVRRGATHPRLGAGHARWGLRQRWSLLRWRRQGRRGPARAERCETPRVPVLACADALTARGARVETVTAHSDAEIDEVLARLDGPARPDGLTWPDPDSKTRLVGRHGQRRSVARRAAPAGPAVRSAAQPPPGRPARQPDRPRPAADRRAPARPGAERGGAGPRRAARTAPRPGGGGRRRAGRHGPPARPAAQRRRLGDPGRRAARRGRRHRPPAALAGSGRGRRQGPLRRRGPDHGLRDRQRRWVRAPRTT